MSAVRFARPMFAASVVGALAIVATVATLFSAAPPSRSQSNLPTRAEAKSCDVLLCSWDALLPTTSTFSGAFGPPGLLSLGSFTDCIGCIPGGVAVFDPRGFAFGLTKLHSNADAPGRAVSEAARAQGGNSGSVVSAAAASSNGQVGLEVASSAGSSAASSSTSIGASTDEVPVTSNPEPGTVVLLATALFVLVPVIRRQRRR